jgi:outer membrane murein-binding lipoprotein Lpp
VTARDRIVLVVVLAVAAIAGSFLMIVKPKRDQAASLGTQVRAEQSQLDSARGQLAQSQAARRAFASEYTQMVQLGEAVPPDDNVPSLVYQLQSAAGAAHVDFRGLQVAPGSPSTPTPPASTSGASGAKGASTSSAQLPPGVAVGAAGFPAEQFTFTFEGNFFRLSDFFNRLHNFVTTGNHRISIRGRLMTLNAISLAPAPKGFPHITASVSATAYVLPASQGLVAGASPTGPASPGLPATTGSGSSSGSTSSTPTAAAAITPLTLR